jgi:hypothetical protein
MAMSDTGVTTAGGELERWMAGLRQHSPNLAGYLDVAMPLALALLRARGGPRPADLERARAFAQELAAHGDELLFRARDSRPGRPAGLAHALAVLAFAEREEALRLRSPGGGR